MKKIIALFVSSIFALSLSSAYAQEESTLNPWERDQQAAPAKKEAAGKREKKTSKAKVKKTKAKAGKKKVSTAKAEKKKEPEKKKRFIFW